MQNPEKLPYLQYKLRFRKFQQILDKLKRKDMMKTDHR